jgi:hypothetical protein
MGVFRKGSRASERWDCATVPATAGWPSSPLFMLPFRLDRCRSSAEANRADSGCPDGRLRRIRKLSVYAACKEMSARGVPFSRRPVKLEIALIGVFPSRVGRARLSV